MMKFFAVLMLLVVVSGCSQQTPVSAMFTTGVAIGDGGEVMYDQSLVGEVERVSSEEAGTRVHLLLDPEKIGDLKKGSAVFLVSEDGASKARIYNYRAGEESLKAGDELVALNNSMELIAWQSGEAFELGQSLLAGAAESVQNYFNSEEWAEQKQLVRDSLSQFESQAQGAAEELQQQYNGFLDQLEVQTEEGRKQAEEKYQALADGLRQQIERSMQDGEKAIADSLEKWLELLEQLMQKYSDQETQKKTSTTG